MEYNEKETKYFIKRWKIQKREDKTFRTFGDDESGMDWSYGTGDYSRPIKVEQEFGTATLAGISPEYRKPGDDEKLLGTEESIGVMIEDLLKNGRKKPIIALDYGGGVGLTWCRLAKRFEKEILEGKLILIVTNIERNYIPAAAADAEHLKLEKENKQLVAEMEKKGLIKYVEAELLGADSGRLKSLRQMKIEYGDGKIPLIGAVDLIHARMSLVHTQVPEIHYPRLLELLSDQGIFIETTYSRNLKASPPDRLDEGYDAVNTIPQKYTFEAYQDAIRKMGLEVVKKVEEGKNKGMDLWATVLRKKGEGSPRVRA